MDFFQSQDQARRNTSLLITLFVGAVLALIVITNVLVVALLWFIGQGSLDSARYSSEAIPTVFSKPFWQFLDWQIFSYVSALVVGGVLLASLYKMLQLRGGGRQIAEALGGCLVDSNTSDSDEQRLLHVVEEMAIASGTAVPPVYLLHDEQGINAFAAGHKPADAVIGVTRGCIQQLDRDQLQGVIAHEFSHILNGDMRLNLRLIAVLNGILFIGLLGRILLRSGSYSSSSSRRANGSTLAIFGLGLTVIGFAGVFFGNLIKAAVSRQREFLADASAVQFTRNPEGLAGALKSIGGWTQHSRIEQPAAEEISHMFFSQAISYRMMSLFATHPPLADRIRRLDTGWRGEFTPGLHAADSATRAETYPGYQEAVAGLAGAELEIIDAQDGNSPVEPAVETITEVAPKAGTGDTDKPSADVLAYSKYLIALIPPALLAAAHDPNSAPAVVFALLLNPDETTRQRQFDILKAQQEPSVYELSNQLFAEMQRLDQRARLPMIELTMPALKRMSGQQRQIFDTTMVALAKADEQIDLFEWVLYRLTSHYLREGHSDGNDKAGQDRPSIRHLKKVTTELSVLLSAVAHYGHPTEEQAQQAFDQAARLTGEKLLLQSPGEVSLQRLSTALSRLGRLYPLQKPLVLKAVLACIKSDQLITPIEAEFLQMIAAILDCPVTPLYAGQVFEETANDHRNEV